MSAPLHAHSATHARRASGGRRRRRVRSLPPRTCSSAAPKSVRPSLTLNTTASLISQQPDGGRKWSFSCPRFCCCCCFNFLLLLLLLLVEATLSLRTVITACLSFSPFPPLRPFSVVHGNRKSVGAVVSAVRPPRRSFPVRRTQEGGEERSP